MFERILVPLDGSPRAELVLSQVGRILRREDAEILLLRVVDIPISIGRANMAPLRKIEMENAQTYVHDLARRFAERGAKVGGKVADGPAADLILETAKNEGATLIAMSTHGRSGVARWALGSVAEKVARASDIPLLLVRSFRRSKTEDLEPSTPEEFPVRRVLVPVDGSPTAAAAISPAEKLAMLYGSEVLVLHVRPPFVPPGGLLPGMEASIPMAWPEPPRPEEDEATLKAAERFRHAGLKTRRLTVDGDPASQILDVCRSERADLIALASHGRSGFRRWALGSVAERVLRSSEVPLLLVRAS
jgi:nucleotide-binding universal stress UspA family protein